MVIEDSAYGVEAGVAAGMRVLGYGGGMAPEESLRAAGAEVFGHMSEVPALLGLAPSRGDVLSGRFRLLPRSDTMNG